MSKPLEAYFGLPDTRPPPCFVIQNDHSLPCGYSARFVDSASTEHEKVVGTVQWRAAGIIVRLSGQSSIVQGTPFATSTTTYNASHLQLLKSNLQKTIRRGLVQAAVSTAREMLNVDAIQVVQRLAIIWIEDCALTDEFPVLPWCLAAMTKGWMLTEGLATVIVSLAGRLAALPVHDVHGTKKERYPLSRLREIATESDRSLLYALQFRRDFQCMSGDKRMIDRCVADWAVRFSHGLTTELALPALPSNVAICVQMTRESWCLAAVDQHSSAICSWIASDLQIPEGRVRSAVWEHSSRTTTKKAWKKGRGEPGTGEGTLALWREIEWRVRVKAEWVLSRLPTDSVGVTTPLRLEDCMRRPK